MANEWVEGRIGWLALAGGATTAAWSHVALLLLCVECVAAFAACCLLLIRSLDIIGCQVSVMIYFHFAWSVVVVVLIVYYVGKI